MAIIVLEHSESAGCRRLGQTLRDHGHRLRVIEVHGSDSVPVDLHDVDGVISCGGPQSLQGSEPWLAREMDLLKVAHAEALPVVGICLGSQILGKALGGEVGRVEEEDGGIELGWHEVCLTDVGQEDPILSGQPWRSMQVHWHREHLQTPPPGARVLACSQRSPVQAWALGLRTYGFQYHPEVDENSIKSWAAEEPQALQEARITIERLNEETRRYYPAFERLSDRLFELMALYLMPADRRIAGLARDLHH